MVDKEREIHSPIAACAPQSGFDEWAFCRLVVDEARPAFRGIDAFPESQSLKLDEV
jgi:hypothetical protein